MIVFNKLTSHCLEFRVTPRVYFLRYQLRILVPSALSVRTCALTLSAIQVISKFFKFLPKKTAFSTMELKNGEGFDVNKVKDMAEVCLC